MPYMILFFIGLGIIFYYYPFDKEKQSPHISPQKRIRRARNAIKKWHKQNPYGDTSDDVYQGLLLDAIGAEMIQQLVSEKYTQPEKPRRSKRLETLLPQLKE